MGNTSPAKSSTRHSEAWSLLPRCQDSAQEWLQCDGLRGYIHSNCRRSLALVQCAEDARIENSSVAVQESATALAEMASSVTPEACETMCVRGIVTLSKDRVWAVRVAAAAAVPAIAAGRHQPPLRLHHGTMPGECQPSNVHFLVSTNDTGLVLVECIESNSTMVNLWASQAKSIDCRTLG